MIRFKQYLQEAKNIPPKIAKQYGEILFGDGRKLSEKDTPFEKDRWNELHHYFYSFDQEKTDLFLELMKIKKHYPDILAGDKTKFLYRGIFFWAQAFQNDVMQTLWKLYHGNKLKIKKHSVDKQQLYVIQNPIVYKPRMTAESWTTSLDVAKIFSGIKREEEVNYIIKADVPQNERLFSAETSNSLKTTPKPEHEVLRVSKARKPIKTKEVIISQYTLDAIEKMPRLPR